MHSSRDLLLTAVLVATAASTVTMPLSGFISNGIGRKHPMRRGMVLTVPASLNAPPLAIFEPKDPRVSTSYVPERNLRPVTSLGASSNARCSSRSRDTLRSAGAFRDRHIPRWST